jgi:hypothetical protein
MKRSCSKKENYQENRHKTNYTELPGSWLGLDSHYQRCIPHFFKKTENVNIVTAPIRFRVWSREHTTENPHFMAIKC